MSQAKHDATRDRIEAELTDPLARSASTSRRSSSPRPASAGCCGSRSTRTAA